MEFCTHLLPKSVACGNKKSGHIESRDITVRALLVIAFLVLVHAVLLAETLVVSGGPDNDYESWIDRTSDDRLMVMFCRNPDWVSGDIYATFSSDDGISWTIPQPAISRSGDQATLCFVVLPDKSYRIWYASNESGGYKIYTAHSEDGLVWLDDGPVDLGWTSPAQYYDPTVILEADGSLTMAYVVSGSGVFIAHANSDGIWDKLKTNLATSAYRPRIIKHSSGQYAYVYHQRTGTSSQYDVFMTTSVDRLAWSTPVRLTTNQNSHDPFVTELQDGSYAVYYAKYTSPAYNINRRTSQDAVTWSPEEAITSDPTNNTQPHLLIEPSATFMTYAHAIEYPDDHDVMLIREVIEEPYVCGDADGSGAVDIDDAVSLIAYIFIGGASPDPIEAGDADCSGNIDIDDVVYLIAYIFADGASPCDPDSDGSDDC